MYKDGTYYTVWIRSDGYINASAHSTATPPSYLVPERFELLLTTQNWLGEAKPLILRRREAAIAAGTYPDWATQPGKDW